MVVVVLHVVRDGIWLGWWWGNLFVAALAGTAVQTHNPGTAQQTRVFALIMVACKPRLTIWHTWVFKGFKPLASGSWLDSCTAAATTTTSSSPTTRSPPMTQATKYARKKCHKKTSGASKGPPNKRPDAMKRPAAAAPNKRPVTKKRLAAAGK